MDEKTNCEPIPCEEKPSKLDDVELQIKMSKEIITDIFNKVSNIEGALGENNTLVREDCEKQEGRFPKSYQINFYKRW